MLHVLVLITSLLVAVMVYMMKQRYFKLRQNVPGLEPQFFIGNLWQMGVLSGVGLTEVYKQLYAKYGDIYQYWNGPQSYYVFNKLEHVMHVLNSKNMNKYERTETEMHVFRPFQPNGLEAQRGRQHRYFARLLYPLFRKSSMPQHTAAAVEKIDEVLTAWQQRGNNSSTTPFIHKDMNDQMAVLTFHLITSQLCAGYDLHIVGDGKNERERAQSMIESMEVVAEHSAFILRYSIPENLAYIYLKMCPSYRNAIKVMDPIANDVVDYLVRLQHDNGDLMTDLESAKTMKDVAHINEDASITDPIDLDQENATLPRKVFADWVLSSFGGAYDAISAYAWFVFYMSKYPHVQEKIKCELREHNITRATPLTAELVAELIYVDCVLKEILRHAPIIEAVTRQVIRPDVVDGVELAVGDRVLFPLYNIHRSKDIWHHPAGPDAFVPERFLEEDKNYPPQALLTFGGGLRQCFGQHLAQFQLKLFFVRSMQRVTFRDAPGNEGGNHHNITGLPKCLAVYMNFEDDNDC